MMVDGLFSTVHEFPDDSASARFAGLVGLDTMTRQLRLEARVLFDPTTVEAWSNKTYHRLISAGHDVMERTPLIVLAGDVGTGKTELAETIGDPIAHDLNVPLTLYSLSLSARGHGAVGEMTTLIGQAFDAVHERAHGGRGKDGRVRHATILLIDEADALAQSRELAQMHHEDRAGVNALIRGIDSLRKDHLPVLTMMCTNRLSAIDPSVRRRAAAVFEFARPSDADREELLRRAFEGLGITHEELDEVVRLTGDVDGRGYGCTYSDLRQRLVPSAVLRAVDEDVPITGRALVELASHFQPTRPFESET